MGAYLKSQHRVEDGPCVRCYALRLMEAVFVGLLLAIVALAWSEQRLALWPYRSVDSAVSVPVSRPAGGAPCLGHGFEIIEADRQGGAVATAC